MSVLQKILSVFGLGIILIGFIFFHPLAFPKITPQASPNPSIAPARVLSFAVIGDPELDLANLKKALELSKSKGLEFAVIMGDLTQVGTPDQFKEVKNILDSSGVTYYVIPGNHDLWLGRKTCQEEKKQTCENIAVYQKYFGNSYFEKAISGWKFIFLDDSDEWLGIGQSQLTWIKSIVNNYNNNQYLVFAHIPFYHNDAEYIFGYQNKALKQEGEDLLRTFCLNPPKLIIYGHLHRTSQYSYPCPNGKILPMAVVGSINKTRNWQLPRFLQLDIFSDGNIKIEEILVTGS